MHELQPPPRISPPKIPEAPTTNYDSLIGGIITLIIGIGSEAVTHPIIPWTFMPGTVLFMFGLGIGGAILETRYPKPGMIVNYIGMAGVLFWFINAWQNISLLTPMLVTGSYLVSRFVLRLTAD